MSAHHMVQLLLKQSRSCLLPEGTILWDLFVQNHRILDMPQPPWHMCCMFRLCSSLLVALQVIAIHAIVISSNETD